MKKIIVPVDFSEGSWQAVETALGLAQRMDAQVLLLHIFDDPFVEKAIEPGFMPDSVTAYTEKLLHKMELDAENNMSQLTGKINEYLLSSGWNIPVETSIKRGLPADEIVRVAFEDQATLLVMATHHHPSIERRLFGTITKSVIQHARCAVLALPPGYVWKDPSQIAYASNLLPADQPAIAKLIHLFQPYKAHFHLVHFYEEDIPEDEASWYASMAAIKADRPDALIAIERAPGNWSERIPEYIKEHQIDLLAVTTRHKSRLQKLWQNSAAIYALYHLDIPLLVFHEKQ